MKGEHSYSESGNFQQHCINARTVELIIFNVIMSLLTQVGQQMCPIKTSDH